jgi:glycine oxidase
MKIVIVGAGIAGLAIGWRLAERGQSVEIVERGIAGRAATWASAGMLAPGAELGVESDALATFAREAKAKWDAFAKELESASGRTIGYSRLGSLIVAKTDGRATVLQTLARELSNKGTAATWLPAPEMRACEPLLSSELKGALHIAGDAQVDNRVLGDALGAALAKHKTVLRENCDVRSLLIAGGAVREVITSQGNIAADAVVLACGAWMNLIGGLAPDILPPVKPAKGQMAALEPPAGAVLPRFLIWSEDVYLVPRRERLFVGATVEDANFDASVTREARDTLLGAAARIVPSLSRWRLAEMWAGLRPRAPDDAPVLGATPVAGLYVAGAQFRNGILFAPAVADAMCGLVLGEAPSSKIEAFDPRRFSPV